MNDEFRQMVIETLRRGDNLPPEWARNLFPPEKREYELVYYGKEREEDIIADTMAVPLQPVSTFGTGSAALFASSGDDQWQNKLIFGDNLQVLKRLLEDKKANKLYNADGTPGVRLIYIDPPFGTGDEYGGSMEEKAYSAKIQGAKFIEFLRKRLYLLRELLAPKSSIYVRLDHHFGHYVKIVMDEVFGTENFQNEIVINRFKRQLTGLTKLNISTDSLFFYSSSPKPVFFEQTRPRLCSFCGQEKEPDWHHMVSSGLRNPPERVIFGRLMFPPKGQHWKYTQANIDSMTAAQRIRINDAITYIDTLGNRVRGIPEFLQTEDTIVDSDWTDLKGYVLSARYPTENAEELLERVIRTSSESGDIVLDAFAGSGTTLAVAEKLGRRWIGIDCGKLAIYTIQKRMLNLKREIGNKGKPLTPKPFTLYNAGLYDFTRLRDLPRDDWRRIALQLFQCQDAPHDIGGFELDGKLKGASVLVFDYHKQPGKRIDTDTVRDIHSVIGNRIGKRFFIIAPRGVFDFQQDYLDIEGVRYYALRIPYSVINELHARDFNAMRQPSNEADVNDIVEAWGFDFIQVPEVEWDAKIKKRKGQLLDEVCIKIKKFESRARIRGGETRGSFETLSMVMLDYDFKDNVFDLDTLVYAYQMTQDDYQIWLPIANLGERIMLVLLDIYGNEARVAITRAELGLPAPKPTSTDKPLKKSQS